MSGEPLKYICIFSKIECNLHWQVNSGPGSNMQLLFPYSTRTQLALAHFLGPEHGWCTRPNVYTVSKVTFECKINSTVLVFSPHAFYCTTHQTLQLLDSPGTHDAVVMYCRCFRIIVENIITFNNFIWLNLRFIFTLVLSCFN